MNSVRLIAVMVVLLSMSAASFALDVLVNQAAFERYAPKTFKVQRTTDYGGNGTFSVRAAVGGAEVCSGL